MKKMLLIVVLSLFCGIVNAANVTGVWQGEYGSDDVQMTLKQTGKRIKGSMVDISGGEYMWSVKGKITGNKIELTFTAITGGIYGGDFTGTLEGDVMDFGDYSYYLTFGRLYECKKIE